MTILSARPIETIAIDGPAGSGKSTVGLGLARELDFLYFDTGVMYRAATLAALHRGIRIDDEDAVSAMAEALTIEVAPPDQQDGRQYTVRVNGEDVTWDIRTPEVEASVSMVSAYSRVRRAMVRQQRHVASYGRVVMVGRDIGTVVMPDADLKIYLVATVEARSQRRHRELLLHGLPSDYDAVLTSMKERDRVDTTRAESPLRPATDAMIVDCTEMDADDTLDYVLKIVETRRKIALREA